MPKEENLSNIKQFCIISILNVEDKLFFGILANRHTNFLLINKFINTLVQKGEVPGVTGYIKHASIISMVIDAKHIRDLASLLLDITNVYGTVPHKLVKLTLEAYHIPGKVQHLLQEYVNHYRMIYPWGLHYQLEKLGKRHRYWV